MSDGYAFYSAQELADAIHVGLLTQNEARAVYWSQFRALKEQALTTPPDMKESA